MDGTTHDCQTIQPPTSPTFEQSSRNARKYVLCVLGSPGAWMASSLCCKTITLPDSLWDLRSYIKFASGSQTQLCRSTYLDAFVQVRQEESLSIQITFSVRQRKLGMFASFHLHLYLWCSQLFTGAILKTPLIKPTLSLISRTKIETVGLCTSPFQVWRLGNGKQRRGDIWRRLVKVGRMGGQQGKCYMGALKGSPRKLFTRRGAEALHQASEFSIWE